MQGSVVNRIMEASRLPEITLGMGGTICMWSDRHPVTVVAIRYAKDGKTVKEIDTVGDKVGPNKVEWPGQSYDITPAWSEGQEIPEHVRTWRMDGRGRLRSTYRNEKGSLVMAPRNGGDGLSLGHRDYYSDPSF